MSTETMTCVAFDAVGTVIYADPPIPRAYHTVARRHGSTLSADEIGTRFRREFARFEADFQANQAATTEEREQELWREIVTAVLDDVDSPDDCYSDLFEWFAAPQAWRVYDDVVETLNELRERGLAIALASNFDARLHSVCAGLPGLREIEFRVVSSEVGFRKPSPRFFDALVATVKCPREQILMVGDTLETDVLGARRCGIRAVWIDRTRSADVSEGRISKLSDIREVL